MASITAIKLSKDDLGELLSQLYLVRAKWYNLGLALGLHSDHLDAIQQQYSAPGDCLREALKLWLSTNPQKGDLIEALKACPVGHESLAYELHGWLPLSPALVQCHNNTSSVQPILESAAEEQKKQPEISAAQEDTKSAVTQTDSTSSTTATNESSSALTPKQQERLKFQLQNDVDEIKNEFAQLQTKIRSSLKKKSVTAKDVATHVIGFGVDEISQEILIKQESLEKIFIVLANECWSFLDCDLLNSILEAYGTKNDRKRMTKYQKKLKEFCKRRVSELPSKVLPLHSSSESQSQILQRDVLIIKWNHNESDPKLQDISLVKRKMCKILSLDSATVDILDIGEGCVKITFSIFKGVSQRLLNKPLSEKQCDAFQIASVISLSCGDYQEIFTVEQTENNGDAISTNGLQGMDYASDIEDSFQDTNLMKIEVSSKKSIFKEMEALTVIASESPLVVKKYKTMDAIEKYMKKLRREKEEYFRLGAGHPETPNEDSDSDERDSDYESELASIIDADFESGDDSDCNCSSIQLQSNASMVSISQLHKSPTKCPDPDSDQQQGLEWEVECTPRVLKKLKYRKTPESLRKAICAAIFHDLAKGRHWHQVKTKDKTHQLFKKKIRGKATILWEKVIQFSAELTDDNIDDPVYTNVIRVWDIVMNEKSYQQVVTAIEGSWHRQRKLTDSASKLCDLVRDIDESQTMRITQTMLNSKGLKIVPSADPDPNQYKPLILHEVPHNIESLIAFSRKFDLPIKLWPEEHKIAHMNLAKPLVVLGRSGTGKTTCCLYRMVQEYLWSAQFHDLPLRQLFVTKNKHLRKKFKDQFFKLVTHHSLPHGAVLDTAEANVHDLHALQCPAFMTSDELFYLLDHTFHHDNRDFTHCCDTNIGCRTTSDDQSTIKEVNISYFSKKIWKVIGKKSPSKKKFDPQLVWMEFMTFIKGFGESQMSELEYSKLSSRVAPNFIDHRKEVYQLYEEYSHHCRSRKTEKLFDKCDMILHLHQKLVEQKQISQVDIPWLFDSLYVDEVQDFTQSEILLLLQCHRNPNCNVFLTGDTAQTVMKDVSFRFKDLRALFHNTKFLSNEAPPLNYLQVNYRSHSGILNLAKSVLDIIKMYHLDSIDVVPSDEALFQGPKPKFIKQCEEDTLMRILASNVRNPSDIQFGHHQAIIIRSIESEEDMPIKNALVFSIYESKGLEFDDVLLYNFFKESKDSERWKKDFKDIPNIELKHLYTAITRAKGNLWIYEETPNQESKLPILRKWTGKEEGLVELIDPSDPHFMPETSFATAKTSTPRQWKLQGDVLRQAGKWRQASFCYQRANRLDLQTETEAEGLEAQQNPNYLQVALAYLKADEISHNIKFIEKIARNLLQAKQFLHAAWLYRRLSKVESAIQAYKRGKHYMEASDLYEEQKEYLDSIQILIDHKLYVEAASKARKLENSGMSLSNDLSSISVAKKHIKKYCKPKWQHKAEKNTFYGLLHHIPAKEEKVTYIKYAKRFTEALEMHFESQEYAKFYRLILAQGPGVMLSTTTLTYYDCGLHLSSVCGHFAMHKTLVINSARSCTKSSGSLPPRVFNELENLSQPDFVDIKTRLNALLLLAKHNDSRIQEAIYVSDLYSCLPFDVELGLLRLKDKENPLSYFIQLAYKVLYLLSLSSDVLAAAYEDILGIHKSKTDQLYLKQERYAKDLGYEFVSDCYLLSHDSQDIWIQTLTKSEDVTKDIDGMWIIPTKIIFTEVKTHLKKVLEKLLTHCFKCEMLLRSPLWKIVKGEIRVSGSTFYPNPVPIRYHLEMYCLVLHSIHLCDSKYRDESIQMLRQYHSIRMSCYFPLCVNFISWKEHIIGKRAWSLLQSQTKKWIDSHVVETARFNFLRLWEQASITDLTQTLKNNLDRLVQTETKHEPLDTEALSCYKTALKWIQVCEEVIIDPLQNCHIFFRNILPQFIALKFDLRGVIDSISIYGTITLALISYVTPSLESSIIVPHMYARALSVYDSLLPKEKRQQNVLNSCCNPNYIKRSTQLSSIRHALVQYLPSALKQIELLLLNEPFKKYSDLLRVISILMLTLYINYVLLAPTSPEIPKFHSRLARCLKQQILKLTHKKSTKEKGSLLYVCTAFHEAETASNLLEILKYLLRPSYVTHNEYESLAVITCSKDHDKIYIEPNEDILLPYAPIVSGKVMMKGDFYIPCEATPLLPEESRKQYLSFRLHQYGELYLIWTSPSSSLAWMHYDECGEEVKQCLQEFILIVLKEGFLSDQPAIAGKSLLQQLLHLPEADITECLGRLKYPQPGWI